MRAVTVLLIVAALGAGYGLGVLSRSDSGGAAGRAERDEQSPTKSGNPASSSSSGGDWAALMDSLVIERPATGSGKIVGRVVDGDGNGVEGTAVVAEPIPKRGGGDHSSAHSTAQGRPKQEPLGKLVKRYAKREAARRAGTREATTDEDGMYALTELGGESYNVTAYKERYRVVAERRRRGWGVEPDAELNFKATQVVPVKFDVTLSGGARPDAANITYTRNTNGRSVTNTGYWTPAGPSIDLPPGAYTVRASLSDGSGATSETESIVVDFEDPPAPVSLRIVIKPSMRITIVPPAGFATVPARPMALRFAGDTPPADDVLMDTQQHMSSITDEKGRRVLRNLEPGRYIVGASLGYRGPIVVRKVVEVADGQLDVDLQLPAPDPAAHSLVRPIGPNGKALTGLDWLGHYQGKNRSGTSSVTALSRSDGVVFVTMIDRYKGLEGEHALIATHERFGTLRAVVDPASQTPVTMQFEEPAFVEVTVAGYRGSGREGRLSLALLQDGVRSRSLTKQPDAAGKATFGPVQPGEYTVRLDVSTARHNTPEIGSTRVSLRTGRQSASLAIPVLHELKITWTGKGKPSFLLSKGSDRRSRYPGTHREVDAKGVAVFRDLLAGEYTIRTANVNKNIEPRTVTVPGTSELTLP